MTIYLLCSIRLLASVHNRFKIQNLFKWLITIDLPLSSIIKFNSLAIKNGEENGPTKRDPACSDLLYDGEQ